MTSFSSHIQKIAEAMLTPERLWELAGFEPNPEQREAILHVDGPLYLPAGPGSGKTRVLLWRTLNLIVFHDVPPEAIYLSTFTEKAALQLREGLQVLLGYVTNLTGQPYDLAQMYVGTVHSLCQRILADRRFSPDRQRTRAPHLLDELGQYFHIFRRRNWEDLTGSVGLNGDEDNLTVYRAFYPDFGFDSTSRHKAVTACQAFFNRLSEECVDPVRALERLRAADPGLLAYCTERSIDPDGLDLLFQLYQQYCQSLLDRHYVRFTDFALLQQAAFDVLEDFDSSGDVFQHVIVDEYQDTNTIQERIFFRLAADHRNICVVGDDDQALYRFRGATVENFVDFPDRCQRHLGVEPREIPLAKNYRSREAIIDFYTDFIGQCDWSRDGRGQYRVPKRIRAHRESAAPAVVASTPGPADQVCDEVADLVRRLIDEGKVEDPNQVAFLFPSLKSVTVGYMQQALEDRGLQVYAPRAGRFIEVPEAVDMLGVFADIFGIPPAPPDARGEYGEFCAWMRHIRRRGRELVAADPALAAYVRDRQQEIETLLSDLEILTGVARRHRWQLKDPYDIDTMKRSLSSARNLSQRAQRAISSRYIDRAARQRAQEGNPISLHYVVRRATSTDWTVLDIFHRLCGFQHFKAMIDLAQHGRDEGPIFNLALLSQYLARFVDEYTAIVTADVLKDGMFKNLFFMSFLFALYRLGESEYEDAEDPFPKGRIPFITIHQSKGLEFPVVVLANPRKRNQGPQRNEVLVRPFLDREPGEPLDRLAEFDIMRMFYVALSRAENLLVIPYYKARGQYIDKQFKNVFKSGITRISDLDLDTIPSATIEDEDLPKPYSYTGDYLLYKRCPRQYMLFRKYGFVPARSQMMFFGSLVHQTLEDLHNYLISQKENPQ